MKPKVAVFSTVYLPYSKTFVHDELTAHQRYEGHVFCARRANLARFPHQPVFVGGRFYEYTRISPQFDRQLSSGGYALIHAHFGTDAVHAVPFARRHGLPLVVTFHGFDVPLLASGERFHPMYWAYALLGPYVLREMALGLCASIELCEMLREIGVPPEKLQVHRLGIDVARFTPGPRRDDADRLVVMVARFVPKKGLIYGIRAFAEVRRATGRGRLVLVGDGPLRPKLEAAARQGDVAAHVQFAGPLPHDEVAALLATADVLMAPSVTTADGDRESGTIVVKEASASGCVPLGTWHGGLPEIVEDGRTGFLVPERDVATLARRLEELLRDPALRLRMAEAGRAKMLAEYDNRDRVGALEEAYDTVTGAARRLPAAAPPNARSAAVPARSPPPEETGGPTADR
ncbi:MAG TPA: glycosyltransferase [Polyangia bacterium]|nr:glycosyltransferase [Polyangia bacterium]